MNKNSTRTQHLKDFIKRAYLVHLVHYFPKEIIIVYNRRWMMSCFMLFSPSKGWFCLIAGNSPSCCLFNNQTLITFCWDRNYLKFINSVILKNNKKRKKEKKSKALTGQTSPSYDCIVLTLNLATGITMDWIIQGVWIHRHSALYETEYFIVYYIYI